MTFGDMYGKPQALILRAVQVGEGDGDDPAGPGQHPAGQGRAHLRAPQQQVHGAAQGALAPPR